MRKLLAVVVALAMMLTMVLPTVASAAVDYSYIKVLLASIADKNVTYVQFRVKGAYRVSGYSSIDLFPGITYTMKIYGTGLRLSYNNGVSTVTYTLPSSATLTQYSNGSSSNFLYINNPGTGYGWRYYSGNMTFRHKDGNSSNTTIELINTLFIETYLYGVVAFEMGDTWPAEALKAQAVASRTYAMNWIRSPKNSAWALDDTSTFQVYRGYPFNSDGTAMSHVIAAVDATRGKVLVTNASTMTLADGMYSASNGGQISTASMRYGTANTYHVFKKDDFDLNNDYSPKYTYYFPKNVAGLSTADKAKAQPMLDLLLSKLPAALQARGITATKDQITINGIKSATPIVQRDIAGLPPESKMFTKIAVTVNVSVGGAATVPMAAVSFGSTLIPSGDETPTAAKGTDFGGVSLSGGPVTRTFTITNSGNTDLRIDGITIDGVNASDYAVDPTLVFPMVISQSESKPFKVTFTPSASGVRTAAVNIESSNNVINPYTFKLTGLGQNSKNNILSYGFTDVSGISVSISDSTIDVTLPEGTPVTNLTALFATDPGAIVYVGDTVQQSGITSNNFTTPLTYTVKAEDGSTKTYTVTVKVATGSGGGGMPASATCDVSVTFDYLLKAADGHWDTLGELRKAPFTNDGITNAGILATASQLWLLYSDPGDPTFLYVFARGYGHGVGMSQRGAQEMANTEKDATTHAKYSYTDILDFYFNISAGKAAIASMPITQKALTQIPGAGSAAKYGKVNASTLNVRATTSTSGTQVGTLTKNMVVEYKAASVSGWYWILYGAKGMVGFVSSKYITAGASAPTASPTPTPTPTPSSSASPSATISPSGTTATPTPTPTPAPILGRVLASELYVRSAPNTTSTKVFTLHKNDIVTITNVNAATNWYKIRYGANVNGYCAYQAGTTTYIEIVGNAPTAEPSSSVSPTTTAGGGLITVPSVTAIANISSGTLSLRASPSTTATVKKPIPAGASFTVNGVDTNALWLKVTYSGTTGYVMAKYAKIAGNTAYRACTITVSQLNVRSGAGTSNGIIGYVKSGNTFVVLSTVTISSTEKWYKVKLNGSTVGYIDYRYARISKNS